VTTPSITRACTASTAWTRERSDSSAVRSSGSSSRETNYGYPAWDELDESRWRVELAEDVLDALPDERAPAHLIQPRGHRRPVDPAELDLPRCLAPHLEQPRVECGVVTTA